MLTDVSYYYFLLALLLVCLVLFLTTIIMLRTLLLVCLVLFLTTISIFKNTTTSSIITGILGWFGPELGFSKGVPRPCHSFSDAWDPKPNTGALTIRIGFGGLYKKSNPQNSIGNY